ANLAGTGVALTETYTVYSTKSIYNANSTRIPGGLDNKISSFQLAQGYAVVVAADPTGMHPSKTYVAAEAPITVNTLPAELDNTISFIRIVPWRDVTKKGHGGNADDQPNIDTGWYYNWQLNLPRGQEVNPMRGEYVPLAKYPNLYYDFNLEEKVMPMDQVTHVLGLNEPDIAGEQAADPEKFYEITNVTVCLTYYDDLQKTGLRIGAPVGHEQAANSDTSWFSRFYNEAKAAGVRMDVIPLHWYDHGGNAGSTPNADPQGVLNRLAKYLSNAYHRYDRTPLWLTEFNANKKRVRDVQDGFLQLAMPYLDGVGYVERYAYFSWMESGNFYSNGLLTTTGQIYKDHVSTIGFTQNILPSALTSVDVGSPSEAGSVIYSSHSGTYTVCGNGDGLGGTNDQFHFLYEAISGDCEIIAKVSSMVPWNADTQAGVMIRESLDAGSTHASMLVTRSNGGAFESRTTTGGTLGSTAVGGIKAPCWVKLIRSGDLLSGYTSPDGVSWTVAGSQTVAMNTDVLVGLMSANPGSKFSDAVLSDVTIAETGAKNYPPIFLSDPIIEHHAIENIAYSGTVAGSAWDPNGDTPLIYSVVDGPAWLSVATNGVLSGTPGSLDVGTNSWTVQVADANGGSETATLNIIVGAVGEWLLAGYSTGSGLLSPNGETLFVDKTTTGGTDITASTGWSDKFAVLIDGAGLWNIGDTVEITGFALPIIGDSEAGDVTFDIRQGAGGIGTSGAGGLASLGTVTASYEESSTELMYLNFETPISFVVDTNSTSIGVHISSTGFLRSSRRDWGGSDRYNITTGDLVGNQIRVSLAGTVTLGNSPDSLYRGWLADNSYPTNAPVSDHLTEYGTAGESPTTTHDASHLYYTHVEWMDAIDRGLTYDVEMTGDLTLPSSWSSTNLVIESSVDNVPNSGKKTVTHKMLKDTPSKFMRLRIEFAP
ncbi:MAG TPA: glycosyl hydrolase, partial [Pontiella sp.]